MTFEICQQYLDLTRCLLSFYELSLVELLNVSEFHVVLMILGVKITLTVFYHIHL